MPDKGGEMRIKNIFVILILVLSYASAVSGQVAAGGDFTLEQDVVAGGGNEANDLTGTLIKVEGTIGQNAVGTKFSGGEFTLLGGFWQPADPAPTAAGVTVSGRVVSDAGQTQNTGNLQGVPNAILMLTGGLLTAPRAVRTNQLGNFTFEGIEPGHFYVLRVWHRVYLFSEDTQWFTLTENLSNVIFRADLNR
jgi:hypothetical protein